MRFSYKVVFKIQLT